MRWWDDVQGRIYFGLPWNPRLKDQVEGPVWWPGDPTPGEQQQDVNAWQDVRVENAQSDAGSGWGR